ncbi:MAG TPA: hypothetical protein VI968_02720 [archaeon]|nr:hypothetical protein [archaeon]
MAESVKPYTMDELREAVEQNRIYNSLEGIYLVNCNVIAKSRRDRFSPYHTRREFEIGRRIFGIAKVPEMYSAEEFNNRNFLAMQLIEGRTMHELSGHELCHALHMRDIEIEKVLDFEIYPFDAFNPENSILTQRGDVVLLDLEFWTDAIDCREMGEFRRRLGKRCLD